MTKFEEKKEQWEVDFDLAFKDWAGLGLPPGLIGGLKVFISSALAQQRELLQTECCMGGCANVNCEHCKFTNLITAKADK